MHDNVLRDEKFYKLCTQKIIFEQNGILIHLLITKNQNTFKRICLNFNISTKEKK